MIVLLRTCLAYMLNRRSHNHTKANSQVSHKVKLVVVVVIVVTSFHRREATASDRLRQHLISWTLTSLVHLKTSDRDPISHRLTLWHSRLLRCGRRGQNSPIAEPRHRRHEHLGPLEKPRSSSTQHHVACPRPPSFLP